MRNYDPRRGAVAAETAEVRLPSRSLRTERVYLDATSDLSTSDFGTTETLASIQVEACPDGYEYLVEAGGAVMWSAAPGAAVSQKVSIYHGEAQVAWHALRAPDGVGSLAFPLVARFATKAKTTLRLVREQNGTTTGACYTRNRYLMARLVKVM